MTRNIKILFLVVLLLTGFKGFTQKDTEFWFVAPEVSKYGSYNMDIPIYLRISTYTQAATVIVSQPANSSFTPIVVSIPANGFTTVDLSPFLEIVENKPANTVLNYGLHITSTTPVNIYYEVASTYCNCNPELFTLKARNALGTNFLIPTQNYFSNASGYTPVPYNAFDIVATTDNTVVTITPSKPIVGHAAGVTFTVTLNQGQSWSGLATSQAAANHLWGSVVTSTQPIAITMTDDLLHGITGCADLVGDQIVPVEITGTDYVVIRGNLTNDGNRAFVVATQDNTSVYIDGNSTASANLNKGQLYDYDITDPSASISTSFPAYVFETSGFGCELGGAIIPSINCNGSTQVVFTRTTSQQLGVQIATQTPYIGSFLLNGNASMITASDFSVVPGTAGNWQTANKTFSLAQIPVGTVVSVTNTSGAFHLGLLIGDVGGGCSYGYFSDFAGLNLGPDLSICQGNTATFDAGSGWNTYLWNTGATTESITTGVAGKYWVYATNAQCNASDTINLVVNSSPHPNLGPDRSFCSGSVVTLSSTGGPFASYLWSTGSTAPSITVSSGGTYSLLVSSSTGCTGSDTIVVTEYLSLPVSVSISATATTVCAGTVVTYTATPVNEGGSPVYQWKVNGTNAGSNSNIFVYTPVDGDMITCQLTSSLSCTSNNPASSNQVSMRVLEVFPVNVSISTPLTTVCDGTSTTFTATPVNEGLTPVYQWKVNGINSGTNSQVFTYTPANADVVSCNLNSSLQCTTNNPAASNQVAMTVIPISPVSISISTPVTTVCAGTVVTYTATPVNQGLTPVYQWKVNGSNAGSNSTVFVYTPVDGDVITCQLTSSLSCATNNPASANLITMSVLQVFPVSVSIAATATSVCAGTSVTFTATAVNPGSPGIYQWKVNGVNNGTNSQVFTYIPLNGDIISCSLNSGLPCTTNNPANSNQVSLTVIPVFPVSITITSSATTVCSGTSVNFNAIPGNPGTLPLYQWKVNGTISGTNSNMFSYIPINGDIVSCDLTSSFTCTTNNPASSNQLAMTVLPILPVSISISVPSATVCSGTAATFTAAPVNPGNSPVYAWKVNGVDAGTNSSTYNYIPLNGDLINCMLTSSQPCTSGNPAVSNTLVMTVNPLPQVSLSRCFDTVTNLNAQAILLKGGIPAGGIYSGAGVSASYFHPAIAGTGNKTVTYVYQNLYLCSASATRSITVLPVPSFSCGQTLTDPRDLKTYPTVSLGSQCWMKTNLNYGNAVQGYSHQTDNCLNEKYCYNNDASNCSLSGGLYQWDEMMGYQSVPGSQGLCMAGWHVPTQSDWLVLFSYYQGQGLAGKPLQDTIAMGFHATESGLIYSNQVWAFNGFATIFWTSNSSGTTKAISHGMNLINFSVSDYSSLRSNAFPVRCVKD